MPVFNELNTIDEIIPRVLAVPLRVELIVIDDCSTDGTRDRLAELQQQYGFTLLLQARNQGKGAAIRRGFDSRHRRHRRRSRTPTSNTRPKSSRSWSS